MNSPAAEHIPQDSASAKPPMTRRRQVLAAVLLGLAALALWSASRLRWARVVAEDSLSPAREFSVNGAAWSPWLTPVALVLLAAILAAFSVRGWGLRVLAILVAAAGVLSAFPAISLLTGGTDAGYAADAGDIPDRYQVLLVTTDAWSGVVVLVGTVCAVLAAILLLRIANGAAGMSTKYTTPAARREELERQIFADHDRRKAAAAGPVEQQAPAPEQAAEAPPNERMMWDALDTGIDPTEADTDTRPDKP